MKMTSRLVIGIVDRGTRYVAIGPSGPGPPSIRIRPAMSRALDGEARLWLAALAS
jgi:hypothetical protein